MVEKQLFYILEHLPGFVCLLNDDYSVLFANRYFRESFGDPQGKRCYEVYHGSKEPCRHCSTVKVFGSEGLHSREWTDPGGKTYQIYDYPFKQDNGAGMVLKLGVDISERKLMEEEAVRVRKLESMALLAAGVAHDFNNLVTSVLGNISFAKSLLRPDQKAFALLNNAEKASLRVKDLTAQLLSFSNLGPPFKKTTSISSLLQEVSETCLQGTNVICNCLFPDDLLPVKVDEVHMSRAFYNLLSNACNAMPEGGMIDFGGENIALKRHDKLPLEEGNYVRIFIRDYGIGIPKEYIHKIFDPYFTTQAMDNRKGIGLGLAICHTILRNHNGYLTAVSEEGQGTTVYVYLPASEA